MDVIWGQPTDIIKGIDMPGLPSRAGRRAKRDLERRIMGRES